jgi:cyclic di-GMP phosphodiesterase
MNAPQTSPQLSRSASPATLEPKQAQLLAYAHDFRELAAADREKAVQLERAYGQLQSYARDLKAECAAERQRSRELEHAYYDSVRRLVAASRYKDQETGKHTDRVSHYAREVAEHIGWEPAAVRQLYYATPMHDVGKIAIPDEILLKPGPLTEVEQRVVERHTLLGAALLKGSASPLLELARQIALCHHEHWDGTGYPAGLKGERIPRAARIVMLGDQYDALRSARPYKPGFGHDRACDVILNGDERTRPEHFDPELLSVFRLVQGKFKNFYAALAD